MHSRLLLLCVLLAGPVLAQRTWVVDLRNRPGTDFLDLPAAVAAAADGDILLVRGTPLLAPTDIYNAPIIDGKGLVITGADINNKPIVYGQWGISNLSASQKMVLSNIKFGTIEMQFAPVWSLRPTPYRGLLATDVAGPLIFDGCEYGTHEQNLLTPTRFTRCALVIFNNSFISSCGWTIWFEDSHFQASNTYFAEGTGGPLSPGHTLHLRRSIGHFSHCHLRGSDGSSMYPFDVKAALMLCNSIVHVTDHSHLEGGHLYQGPPWAAAVGADPSSTCFLPGSQPATVFLDPSTTVVVGISTWYLTLHNQRVAGLRLDTQTPASLSLTQYADPGNPTLLAAGDLLFTPWTSPRGPILLQPSSLIILGFQITGPTGLVTTTLPIPPGVPLGTTLGLQALELTPAAQILFSNAVAAGVYR